MLVARHDDDDDDDYKKKLASLVEGDSKATFSIATTPRCRGGCNSIPLYCSDLPLIIIL